MLSVPVNVPSATAPLLSRPSQVTEAGRFALSLLDHPRTDVPFSLRMSKFQERMSSGTLVLIENTCVSRTPSPFGEIPSFSAVIYAFVSRVSSAIPAISC